MRPSERLHAQRPDELWRYSRALAGRSAGARQATGPKRAPFGARIVEAGRGPPRPGRDVNRIKPRSAGIVSADPLRAHADLALRVLPRFGEGHGLRSCFDPSERPERTIVRRLPP